MLKKVGGGEKPTPLWNSDNSQAESILYKIDFKLKVSY